MNSAPDPRRWRGLFALLLGQFCALLDVSVTNVALPSIERSTGAGPSEVQWVVSGYILAFALMPVIGGRLGDTLGRRRIFFIGVTGFIIASMAVGLSPVPLVMIGARVIQGLFGGLMGPQVSGYIQNTFTGAERGRAFGGLGASVGIATALGPVVGGLLIGLGGPDFGWRLVFFINVPTGILGLILAALWVPAITATASRAAAKLDIGGALLLGAAILCVLFPIVEINEFHSGWLFLLFLPGAVLLWRFLRREARLSAEGGAPLLNLTLFSVPTFTTGFAFALVFFCGNTGVPLVISLFYQQGLGFTALESGLGVTALALGTLIGASVAGRLVSRIGRPLLIGAVLLFFLATLAIALVVHELHGETNPPQVILDLVGPLFAFGYAGGSIVTPNQTLSLADVDPRMGGVAGGVLQTAQRTGSATGQTVLGTLFFLCVAGLAASPAEGTPSAHPLAFANALDIVLFASCFFSAAALILGIVDLRRTRRRVTREDAA
jgi:MFS family permease